MLIKTPKSQNRKFIRKAAAVLFIGEALLFAGSYGIWYKLNTDRDFRFYMNGKCPSILNFYYSLGEKLGGGKDTKKIDFAYWDQVQKD